MVSKSSHTHARDLGMFERERGRMGRERWSTGSSELDADRSQKHLESRELDGVDDGRE